MAEYSEYDYNGEYDSLVGYPRHSRRNKHYDESLKWNRRILSTLTKAELVSFILSLNEHKESINQAASSSFNAYDIALRIKQKGWTPTDNQQEALINVLAYWGAGRPSVIESAYQLCKQSR